MKVLVTGATGLLGSRMLSVFPDDWDVVGAYHSRPVPGMVECCLGNCHSVARAIAAGGYDWVVHCAAIRSPEACASDAREAMAVNAEGTGLVARAATDADARLAYASTDYVFAGDEPPYLEGDGPAPANVYGHSKLAGERRALGAPGGLVVRMPALYSLDLDAPNNVLGGLRDALAAGEAVTADETCTRYYTQAEDVVAAFAHLIAAGHRGVVHVSAAQRSTKLEFLKAAADAAGWDSGLITGSDEARADRPLDSHLDTGLYESLGGPAFTGYRDALAGWRLSVPPGPDERGVA